MKSVILSIRPKWCELIANRSKTIEIRKTRPKIESPFKCYIYCTKPSKKTQTICRSFVLNSDELYRHPVQGIKYGNSIELMGIDEEYSNHNFLNGKVIGEFICDSIKEIQSRGFNNNYDYCYENLNEFGNDDIAIEIKNIKNSCISKEELNNYGNNIHHLYAWHISELKIYDKPKELNQFYKFCGENPYCENCDCYYFSNTECGCEEYCCSNIEGHKPLKRPPQSWSYVESELQK